MHDLTPPPHTHTPGTEHHCPPLPHTHVHVVSILLLHPTTNMTTQPCTQEPPAPKPFPPFLPPHIHTHLGHSTRTHIHTAPPLRTLRTAPVLASAAPDQWRQVWLNQPSQTTYSSSISSISSSSGGSNSTSRSHELVRLLAKHASALHHDICHCPCITLLYD
jgi:hypothetical protein